MVSSASDQRDLHPGLYLGVPVFSVLVLWTVPLLGRRTYELLIPHEIGFLEIGTVVFLLPAVVLGVLCFLLRKRMPRGVGWLMLLGALAALYFAGEEISWGQTYFHWKTPEGWARLNEQHETNLHNLELVKYGWGIDLLDDLVSNVPRQLMLGMCLIGGVILPLALHRRLARPEARGSYWYWLIPSWRLVPAALLAVGSTLPEKLYDVFVKHSSPVSDWPRNGYAYMAFVDPAGEFKEYCFALVMLLYLLSVYTRARRRLPEEPASMKRDKRDAVRACAVRR